MSEYSFDDFWEDIHKLEHMTGYFLLTHCYFCDKPFTPERKGKYFEGGSEISAAHAGVNKNGNPCAEDEEEYDCPGPMEGRNTFTFPTESKRRVRKLVRLCYDAYVKERGRDEEKFLQRCHQDLKGLKDLEYADLESMFRALCEGRPLPTI